MTATVTYVPVLVVQNRLHYWDGLSLRTISRYCPFKAQFFVNTLANQTHRQLSKKKMNYIQCSAVQNLKQIDR
jgi:hypothetical protein